MALWWRQSPHAATPARAARWRRLRPGGVRRASGAGAAGRLAGERAELAGAQVAQDDPVLGVLVGREVDVHLVGAELCAALAHAREIERGRIALAGVDAQHMAPAALVARNEQVDRLRQRRALDQAVDGVHVAPAGRTAPEMQTPRQV